MAHNISPVEAKRLIDEEGALLVDIREPNEFAREHIKGARLMPLTVFSLLAPAPDRGRLAIFHCQSGNRSHSSAAILEKHGFAKTYLMDGGIIAWEKAGLPVSRQAVPIPLPRQLQIVAGSMIIIFSSLNFFMPVFNWLTLLIGANLLFAGSTGLCFMANLLMRMPWNRKEF